MATPGEIFETMFAFGAGLGAIIILAAAAVAFACKVHEWLETDF